MTSNPSLQQVEEFLAESFQAIFRGPYHFVDSAEALDALLFGLDAVRRFCQGNSVNKSWNGFSSDWREKGFPESKMMLIVEDRLQEQGIENPTSQERMQVVVDIWHEVTNQNLQNDENT